MLFTTSSPMLSDSAIAGKRRVHGVRGSHEVTGELAGLGREGAEAGQFSGSFSRFRDGPAIVLADAHLEQADALRETLRFGVGVRADDADGGHGFGLLRSVRAKFVVGLEAALVMADGGAGGVA